MYFIDDSPDIRTHLLNVVFLSLMIFVGVKCLYGRAYKLNKNNLVPVIWILFQKHEVTFQLIDQAGNGVVGIDTAHDQGLIPTFKYFKSFLQSFLISLLKLIVHEGTKRVLDCFEDSSLRYFFHKLLIYACMSNSNPNIITMEVDAEATTFEEF